MFCVFLILLFFPYVFSRPVSKSGFNRDVKIWKTSFLQYSNYFLSCLNQDWKCPIFYLLQDDYVNMTIDYICTYYVLYRNIMNYLIIVNPNLSLIRKMLCKNQLREHGSWGISLAFSGSTPLLRDLRKASAETNILGSWDSVENCRWILKPTRTPKSKDFGVEKHGKTTQSLSVCFGEVDRKISDWFLFLIRDGGPQLPRLKVQQPACARHSSGTAVMSVTTRCKRAGSGWSLLTWTWAAFSSDSQWITW